MAQEPRNAPIDPLRPFRRRAKNLAQSVSRIQRQVRDLRDEMEQAAETAETMEFTENAETVERQTSGEPDEGLLSFACGSVDGALEGLDSARRLLSTAAELDQQKLVDWLSVHSRTGSEAGPPSQAGSAEATAKTRDGRNRDARLTPDRQRVVVALEARTRDLLFALQALEFDLREQPTGDAELRRLLELTVVGLELACGGFERCLEPAEGAVAVAVRSAPEIGPSLRMLARKALALSIAAANLRAALIPAAGSASASGSDAATLARHLGLAARLLRQIAERLLGRSALEGEALGEEWKAAQDEAERWRSES